MTKPAWAAGTAVLAANTNSWPVFGAAVTAGTLAVWAVWRSFRSVPTFVPLGLARISVSSEALGLSDISARHFMQLGAIETGFVDADAVRYELASNRTSDGWSAGREAQWRAALTEHVDGLATLVEGLEDIPLDFESLEVATAISALGRRALRAKFPLPGRARQHLAHTVETTTEIQRAWLRHLPEDPQAFQSWTVDMEALGARLDHATGMPASGMLEGIEVGRATLWALDRSLRYHESGVPELADQFLGFADWFAKRVPKHRRDDEGVKLRALYNLVEVGLRSPRPA